jgi:hypothetical protein
MKIYDCFTFYNELDLLDIRLQEMHTAVDHFVIVEATTTFQNTPKPLYLKDNWDRYAKYHDKIIHVVVDDMPGSADPWENEEFQRNAILRGLVTANPEDLAIVSDVDEVIRASAVNQMRNSDSHVFGLRMPYFNFKLNYMLNDTVEKYCVWAVASKVAIIGQPEELRNGRWGLNTFGYGEKLALVELIEHAGWHFTYMGDTEFIKNKIRSFSHAELNTTNVLDQIDVDAMIAKGVGFNPLDPRPFVPVALDSYMPAHISEYTKYTISGATTSAASYLPE